MSPVHSVSENVLCVDLAGIEIETLFVFLYFKDGPIEVYFPEGNVNNKFS